mmetsp:Transcript_40514/g.39021  ORF Transcript_40514/g.39021 Transcript_40514/m.39021 type:complete len:407 (+) Transcript_40514:1402-2622(+)
MGLDHIQRAVRVGNGEQRQDALLLGLPLRVLQVALQVRIQDEEDLLMINLGEAFEGEGGGLSEGGEGLLLTDFVLALLFLLLLAFLLAGDVGVVVPLEVVRLVRLREPTALQEPWQDLRQTLLDQVDVGRSLLHRREGKQVHRSNPRQKLCRAQGQLLVALLQRSQNEVQDSVVEVGDDEVDPELHDVGDALDDAPPDLQRGLISHPKEVLRVIVHVADEEGGLGEEEDVDGGDGVGLDGLGLVALEEVEDGGDHELDQRLEPLLLKEALAVLHNDLDGHDGVLDDGLVHLALEVFGQELEELRPGMVAALQDDHGHHLRDCLPDGVVRIVEGLLQTLLDDLEVLRGDADVGLLDEGLEGETRDLPRLDADPLLLPLAQDQHQVVAVVRLLLLRLHFLVNLLLDLG